MHRWLSTVAALVLVVGGCQEPAPDESPATTPTTTPAAAPQADAPPLPFELTAEQEAGKAVYDNLCWTCHGTAGRGDGPEVVAGTSPEAASFHDPVRVALSPEQMADRLDEAMAADPEHPHTRFLGTLLDETTFREALDYLPALVYPQEIEGSAMAGRTRYTELCVGCHGPTGRGDGPAANLMVVQPASFPVDTLLAAGDFQAVHDWVMEGSGRVHGASMPPWDAVLTDAEMWDVVAYVATLQPGALEEAPPGP